MVTVSWAAERFGAHVATAAGPFVGSFGEDGADEPDDARSGATCSWSVRRRIAQSSRTGVLPFVGVGADLLPVFDRE